MIEHTDVARAEMLTLAALSYRGFADLLRGGLHQDVVRQQVSDGLDRLAPVRGRWDLVWGPVTAASGDQFDSSAMYVVRSRVLERRYVIAVRGTNPVSLTDWLLGDFVVGTTVAWPFVNDGSAISSSTALGLRTLLGMVSAPTGSSGSVAAAIIGGISRAAHPGTEALEEIIRTVGGHRDPQLRSGLAPIEAALLTVVSNLAASQDLPQKVERRLIGVSPVHPSELRPVRRQPGAGSPGKTLVEFLADERRQHAAPLEVIVTGHSKGGALAPALALCLKDTRLARDNDPGWDASGQSEVGCVTFAGPTPGNRAFANLIDAELGSDHERIANTNDVVTHAWDMRQLQQIAFLFEARSAPLQRLVTTIADSTRGFDYAHATTGALLFAGETDTTRSFAAELIHQHLDAYLDRFGLRAHGIDALTLFVG